jgi:hypothetical protein
MARRMETVRTFAKYICVFDPLTQLPPKGEGLLKHGSYHLHGGLAIDDYMIWGDYFYLEALMRLERGIEGYWYERNSIIEDQT